MKLTNSQLQAVDDIECSQKHIVIEVNVMFFL